MHINELRNLVVLSRTEITSNPNREAAQAQAAWASIASAEKFIADVEAQEAAKTEAVITEDNEDGTESTFTTVDIEEDGVDAPEESCEESCEVAKPESCSVPPAEEESTE